MQDERGTGCQKVDRPTDHENWTREGSAVKSGYRSRPRRPRGLSSSAPQDLEDEASLERALRDREKAARRLVLLREALAREELRLFMITASVRTLAQQHAAAAFEAISANPTPARTR